MKKHTIKSHLSSYSILQKRRTTLNHAFASAIAPADQYDEEIVDAAIRSLGQDPDGDLACVYCRRPAITWDHLVGLVEKAELRGYGHQVGNLVPCCRECNEKKGAKDWEVYLQEMSPNQAAHHTTRSLLASYIGHYAKPVDLKRAAALLPKDWKRYAEIKQSIFKLMAEADTIAARLREAVVAKSA